MTLNYSRFTPAASALLTFLVICGCTKTKKEDFDHFKVIPSDANVVIEVNIKSLAAFYDKSLSSSMPVELKAHLNTFELMKAAIGDSTGIDLGKIEHLALFARRQDKHSRPSDFGLILKGFDTDEVKSIRISRHKGVKIFSSTALPDSGFDFFIAILTRSVGAIALDKDVLKQIIDDHKGKGRQPADGGYRKTLEELKGLSGKMTDVRAFLLDLHSFFKADDLRGARAVGIFVDFYTGLSILILSDPKRSNELLSVLRKGLKDAKKNIEPLVAELPKNNLPSVRPEDIAALLDEFKIKSREFGVEITYSHQDAWRRTAVVFGVLAMLGYQISSTAQSP
ncbi:MAG: hypothetical protein JRJ87_24605 [Deltaproteobacteria bacterium]|nr:hypothetical protein [Deltaproteobacteria bacterium]